MRAGCASARAIIRPRSARASRRGSPFPRPPTSRSCACARRGSSASARRRLPTMNVRVPTLEQTGPRGGADMPALLAELTRLTRWVNYLGVPSLVVPCGFDSRGLPIGLQLVGRPFAEATLLAAGHAFQHETDWHSRVPAERWI